MNKITLPSYLTIKDNHVIDRLDKLTPGAVDKAAHLYNVMLKYAGGESSRIDKLCELNTFIYIVLKNPKLLHECPLRPKKRGQKMKDIM